MVNTKDTILIVEDDIALLDTFAEFLSHDFEQVLKAIDGVSAFLTVNENHHKLSLILSDIKMPGWDGIQFVTELRSQGINTPVIFTSGTADREEMIKALRLGAVDFIPKPFKFEEIRTAIFRVLEISKRESEVSEIIKIHGKESVLVNHQNKMIGRFRAANAKRKPA
ncbi:MAG: response regulator [Bdellovibrio sp.]